MKAFFFRLSTLSRFRRWFFLMNSLLLLSACASTSRPNIPPSYALPKDNASPLVQHITPLTKAHPNKTGFYPLGDGRAALLSRLALIDQAKASLDVQYYIYRDDDTSRLLTWHLYKAAQRGVRIRLLLDDMQSRDDADFAMLAAQPNVQVRLFNPFSNRVLRHTAFITNFDQSNRRMHNKALIADGVLAITGGRNIGDEYFSANKSVEFGDLDLLMIGNAVPQVERQFDEYWNSPNAHPIQRYHQMDSLPNSALWAKWEHQITQKTRYSAYFKSLLDTPLLIQLKNQNLPFYWGEAKVIYDNPNKVSGEQTQNPLLDAITASLTQAKHEYLLISPYFVPTQAGTQALVNAVKQGKKVTIITNSLASNDVFSVHGWYAKYRKALLKGGVSIYETKAPPQITQQKRSMTGSSRTSLHAKSFIVDHSEVFVGSFNFDPRSAHLNTEMGVFIDSPAFANDIYDALQVQLKRHAYRLKLNNKNQIEWIDDHSGKVYTTEPDASLWQRIGAKASGWLPIEKHL